MMTQAIKSNGSLLSIDYITRTHTQMRKSPRAEKESRKEMRRERKKGKNKKCKKTEILSKIKQQLIKRKTLEK